MEEQLVEELLNKMDHLLIVLKEPGPEELDRAAIWRQARLKPEIAIFDLDEVFISLKELAIARDSGRSWFEWMKWVFWG